MLYIDEAYSNKSFQLFILRCDGNICFIQLLKYVLNLVINPKICMQTVTF